MADDERIFREEVLQRLTRIEGNLCNLKSLPGRVGKLEAHRNWLAGVVAAGSALAGYIHIPFITKL